MSYATNVFAVLGLLGWCTLPSFGQAPDFRIRKNVMDLIRTDMSADPAITTEWEAFRDALLEMKRNGSYDQFTEVHHEAGMASRFVDEGTPGPDSLGWAHRNSLFTPWHRKFIWDFETILMDTAKALGGGTTPLTGLPYWEWSVDNQSTGVGAVSY
jgi:hypothetical protein